MPPVSTGVAGTANELPSTLNCMRRLPGLFLAVVVGLLLAAAPGSEAAPPKTAKATIAVPALDAGHIVGGGAVGLVDTSQVRQTCPTGGALDGIVYKFFDLKGGFTKFTAMGPMPIVTQTVPAPVAGPISFNEYDLDVFAFDAKCKRIAAPAGASATGTSLRGVETLKIKKPARYVAVTYYSGPYPNIEITLEYSN